MTDTVKIHYIVLSPIFIHDEYTFCSFGSHWLKHIYTEGSSKLNLNCFLSVFTFKNAPPSQKMIQKLEDTQLKMRYVTDVDNRTMLI